MGRPAKEYALYRGDDFVDIGTKRELGKRYGIPLSTLDDMTTERARERYAGSGLCLVDVTEEEDGEAQDGKAS